MEINGVEICVDTTGQPTDPAVLLIAGAASAMDWWRDGLVQRLAAGGRYVIRYDTRDTGQSVNYPAGEPGYTFMDLVDDAVGVLDELGVRSAQIVGISMGGALAQVMALQHPDRVDSLVLLATTSVRQGQGDLPGMTPELAEFFADHPQPDYTDRTAMVANTVLVMSKFEGPAYFDEEWVRATAGRVFDRTRSMAASEQNHMLIAEGDQPDLPLNAIERPTLVLHGTADPLFPIEHGEALARAIPGAVFRPLPGVGHQPPPPALWDTVVPWILELGHEGREP
jgi:pimeloyl-ACP methyl ester carboxylesterase